MTKLKILLVLLVTSIYSYGQIKPQDGYFRTKDFKNAKPTQYSEILPENIGMVKRIWRDIDLTNGTNKIFSHPQSRLIDILKDAIEAGKIIAYSAASTKENPTGDAFVTPLNASSAFKAFQDSVIVPVFDSEGNQIDSRMMANDFNPDSVTKFRIKEDWVFDKSRGIFEPRIIGLAPLVKLTSSDGLLIAEQPAFWIYFPEARYTLCQKEVIAGYSTDLSFDDLFTLRKFQSTIIKEATPSDLKITDYAKTDDEVKQESARIEKSLADFRKELSRKPVTN